MTFLDKIIARKRESVARQLRENDIDVMREMAKRRRESMKAHRFRDALSRPDYTNIIAEIKRASPSKGIINDTIDVADIAKTYSACGAAAISVLTETDHFRGSLDDLRAVRAAVELPILRKDFIVDEFQIYESAAFGADAILLIVAALTNKQIERFLCVASDELRIDAIVEVHTAIELERAAHIGADIIGVNNRDLHTLDVSLDTSRELLKFRSPDTLMLAESGITDRAEIDELRELGCDGFLIGEALMTSSDLRNELQKLVG